MKWQRPTRLWDIKIAHLHISRTPICLGCRSKNVFFFSRTSTYFEYEHWYFLAFHQSKFHNGNYYTLSFHVCTQCPLRHTNVIKQIVFQHLSNFFFRLMLKFFSLNIFYLPIKQTKWIRHKLNKLMKSSPNYNMLQ